MPYVYEERTPKAWSITCVTIYLVGVAWMGVTSLPEDLGPWLAVSTLFLLFLLLPCLIVPISKHVYHRIRLTPETLRVGRERLAVGALDPASIRAAHQQSGAAARRIAAAVEIDHGARARHRAGTADKPRLMGGAWLAPMGMAVAIIATRDGEHLGIATRDREGLLRALLAVTPPY